jgi:transposase-like protein
MLCGRLAGWVPPAGACTAGGRPQAARNSKQLHEGVECHRNHLPSSWRQPRRSSAYRARRSGPDTPTPIFANASRAAATRNDGRHARTTPPEFRQRAVQLAREGTTPVVKIAKDLGISESCLRNWMAQAAATARTPFERDFDPHRVRKLRQRPAVTSPSAARSSQPRHSLPGAGGMSRCSSPKATRVFVRLVAAFLRPVCPVMWWRSSCQDRCSVTGRRPVLGSR